NELMPTDLQRQPAPTRGGRCHACWFDLICRVMNNARCSGDCLKIKELRFLFLQLGKTEAP
ncbi:MAG TPA: hypothetical protein VNV14_00765, partial [Opitutaceae bacterium]|nr:hypothetical protein [Opitutaceae bacterium]